MKLISKILFFAFMMANLLVYGQTVGLNYQALILAESVTEIPGTDIVRNDVPLSSEKVTLRFTVSNEDNVEYVEEHTVITDENGLVSLIVGEGKPVENLFTDIFWDGKLKYLDVEIDILSNSEGFTFLNSQKILYIPHNAHVKIVDKLSVLGSVHHEGDMVWLTDANDNKNPSLMIWSNDKWIPVSEDIDPTNELKIIVVEDDADRSVQLPVPVDGDQVWNKATNEVETYIEGVWKSSVVRNIYGNGLNQVGNVVELGGELTKPTEINTSATNTLAIKNMLESNSTQDQLVVVEPATGVLRTKSLTGAVQKKEVVYFANDGQSQFNTPFPIDQKDRVDVYRNGVKIDFTVVGASSIEVESEAVCYKDDKIRIVQLYIN